MTTTPCQRQIASFTNLYDAYSPALFALLVKLVGDYERAEDLLHDSFVKIWVHFHRYDPQQGGLYNWVTTIARHVAMDELRRRKAHREAATYLYEQTRVESQSTATLDLSSEHFYSLLPAKYSQVLHLIYTQGLTHLEIAQELDLPLGTVKTRSRVGLQKLQQIFSQDIYHYQLA